MTLRLLVVSLGLLSIKFFTPAETQNPWILPGTATLHRGSWPLVSCLIVVDTGEKILMIPSETREEMLLKRDRILGKYIHQIQINPDWDPRVSLRVYRQRMLIEMVLSLEDGGEAKNILNQLVASVLKENPRRGGGRSYIGLEALGSAREISSGR